MLKVADSIGSFLGLTDGTPLHRKLSQLAILLFFIAVTFAVCHCQLHRDGYFTKLSYI